MFARRALCRLAAPLPSFSLQLRRCYIAPAQDALLSLRQNLGNIEVQKKSLQVLVDFDTCDQHTEAIVEGAKLDDGMYLSGIPIIAAVLKEHVHDAEIAEKGFRLVANMCWLTLENTGDVSHQARLGDEGVVEVAAEALQLYGKSNPAVCRRVLHALVNLTMFNMRNTTEALNAELVTTVTAVLANNPDDADLQDTGLTMLLRLLNAPLEDHPEVDFLYEKDPSTMLGLLVSAAVHHPHHLHIHEKVWHGLALLAHNHQTLPHAARRLAPKLSTFTALLEAMLEDETTAPLRPQILTNFASVCATLVTKVDDVDLTPFTSGGVSQVAVKALNTKVDLATEYSLVSLLLTLSSHEDPVVLGQNAVATLLHLAEQDRSPDAKTQLLRVLWNILNYKAGKESFVQLDGPRRWKAVDLPPDEETQKLSANLLQKAA